MKRWSKEAIDQLRQKSEDSRQGKPVAVTSSRQVGLSIQVSTAKPTTKPAENTILLAPQEGQTGPIIRIKVRPRRKRS